MKQRYKLLLICSLFSLSAVGQNSSQPFFCGFDIAQQQLINSDPSYRQKEENTNRRLYQQAINQLNSSARSQTTLSIPVVVHIVHQNGVENISDSVVWAGMNQLNLRFQNAAPYHDISGNDVGIQFCLASVDPYGNPTTGITRNVSPFTDLSAPGASDFALKNVNRWDPHIYLNVWVIKDINDPLAAAYATFPTSAGSSIDGIVITYSVFTTFALAHEVGHYLGLYHTFEGGCTNFNCLLDGDHVCDTPPDATNSFTCPMNSCASDIDDTSGFGPFATDVNDAPNYMDYTNCALSFTVGQSSRMNASLNLIRITLLLSNGCGDHPGGPVPVASFAIDSSCGNVFTNTSSNALGAQWDFDSDGTIDNYGGTVSYNPPVTGNYTVTMYTTGYGGTDTVTQTFHLVHYPYPNYPLMSSILGVTMSASGRYTACPGATITIQGEPGMAHYHWSTGDTTQNITFIQGTSSFTIYLYAIDSTGFTWTACSPAHADAVPATIPPVISIDPNDTIFCVGDPINLLISYSPIWQAGELLYNQGNIWGFHNSTFTTTLASIGNNYTIYQIDTNGCTSTSNTVNVLPNSPVTPTTIIPIGNNLLLYPVGVHHEWYFNGVPIPNSDVSTYQMTQQGCYKVFAWWTGGYDCGTFSSDSVCLLTTAIPESNDENAINISPNPFSSQTILSFAKEQKDATVMITDALGKRIKTINFSGKQLIIEKGEMAAGIYFIQITDQDKNVTVQKIIIQ